MRAGCGKGCRVGGGWGKGYPQRGYPRISRIPQMVYPQMRTNFSQIDTDDLWVFVYLFVKICG